MKKMSNVYIVDFETNNSLEAIENQETWVWLWDICNIKDFKHATGKTLDSLFKILDRLGDSVLYSHNLKFDGSFIIAYLLAHGYVWVDKNTQDLKPGEFSTIIDGRKVYYRISYASDNAIVEFRDSCKKIPGTVKSIAESWKLPILKGEIDYRLNRPRGWEPTEEEIAYIHNDTEIIARVMRELYKENMTSLTASSDSFKAYKKTVGRFFETFFPVLPLETDDYIRKSYYGGVCMYNPDYKEIELSGVNCYDVNSMYPSIMYDEPLPWGEPVYREGKPEVNGIYNLYIAHIQVQMRVKKGFFPSIMKRGFGLVTKNEYITDTENTLLDLYLTNVDMELMFKHYDVYHINYIDFYSFRSSRNLFKNYIKPLYETKCNSSGAVKQLAKLKLNSLYGKFATNPYRKVVEPYFDDGVLRMRIVDNPVIDPIYTATSSFVTAYARRKLFLAIEENHSRFVYCDTDSIHVIGEAVGIEVDKTKLGAWDLEKEYDLFKVLAQKTYYGITKSNKTIIKVCGAPDKVKAQITYDRFKFGETFEGKLRPVLVKGGVVLVDTCFTFKER